MFHSSYLLFLPFLLAAQGSWNLYTSSAGNFSILFPGTVEDKSTVIDTEAGLVREFQFVHTDNDRRTKNILYIVSYTQYSDGTLPADSIQRNEDILLGVMESASLYLSGELLYQTNTNLSGEPAFLYKIAYNNSMAFVKGKVFIHDDRVYHLRVFSERQHDLNKDINRFLDSFRLIES